MSTDQTDFSDVFRAIHLVRSGKCGAELIDAILDGDPPSVANIKTIWRISEQLEPAHPEYPGLARMLNTRGIIRAAVEQANVIPAEELQELKNPPPKYADAGIFEEFGERQ